MSQAISLASSVAERCLRQVASVSETLTGSLDLAVMLPGPRNPHLLAAHDAAASLSLQLRLLRSLWAGTAGPLRASRLPDLLRGAPGWERVRLDLAALPARTVLAPPRARVVLGAILLAAENLPDGGSVSLSGGDQGAIDVAVQGGTWPEELGALLSDAAAASEAAAAGCMAALLVLLADGLGVPLSLLPAMSGQPERLRIGRQSRR